MARIKGDFYTRLSRSRGYRSRAAFKLLEANERFSFIRKGDCVVDLGAYPGGWTQVVRSIVGKEGYVLAVDVKGMKKFSQPNVECLVGDLLDPAIKESIREKLPRKADVVLSDASPKLTGVHDLDHLRQMDLTRASFAVALDTLRPKGSLFVKAFQGDQLNGFVTDLKRNFEFVKRFKPKSSKPKSREIYVLARGLEQR